MKRILLLALVLVVLAGVAEAKKKSSSSRSKSSSSATSRSKARSSVRPVTVYSLTGCQTCASLKSRLRRSGVKLNISHVSERYFEYYPTVVYTNDTSDHGGRIFGGRCSLPKSLDVYETD